MTIKRLCEDAFENAADHGWWDAQVDPGNGVVTEKVLPTIPEKLCLIHSEVSEALEAYRDGQMAATISETGKPEGFLSELADVYIRIGDLVGALGLSSEFAAEVEKKMAYNEARPYRHGGKAC